MKTLTLTQGSKFPAFPGYIAATDKSKEDRSKVVALRIAPLRGTAVEKAFAAAALRTVRIQTADMTKLRIGDQVVIPASEIRQVSTIPVTDKETGEEHPMYQQDANGKTVIKDGKPIELLAITVLPGAPIERVTARIGDEMVRDADPVAVDQALAAW